MAAAQKVVGRIFAATDHLEQFKRMGRVIPEFRHPDYRQVWLKPCWIYYRVAGETVYILPVRRSEKLLRTEDLLEE